MSPHRHRIHWVALLCAAAVLGGASAWLVRPSGSGNAHAASSSPVTRQRARAKLAWSHLVEGPSGYAQPLDDGRRIELTLEPRLQHAAEALLDDAHASYGAAVLVSVADGRVLAMAGHSDDDLGASPLDVASAPAAPAASIFKLVTTSALLEAGVGAEARVCYHAGIHSVEASNLSAHPRLDRACNSLAYALAKSQNAIIARLAIDHLAPAALLRMAHRLGFGTPLSFDGDDLAPSLIRVPTEPLGFARVAAGFGPTTLSPLHAAQLVASIAAGGARRELRMIDRVVDVDGTAERAAAVDPEQLMGPRVAAELARMMVGTTQFGTARRGFHDARGQQLLRGVSVAGKTGTLNRAQPFRAYSWFVGFAPADRPEVAVVVLLGHDDEGHGKAHPLAAQLLSQYFAGAVINEIATR